MGSSCENNNGTTSSPIVQSAPHHSAANSRTTVAINQPPGQTNTLNQDKNRAKEPHPLKSRMRWIRLRRSTRIAPWGARVSA
ncbi:hypothetical protein GCM10009097_22640 [Pigmentiphaga daeguensis]|uniref:Uncharacterized protein n=1 Tax=Pigmentiphaga daeguensis TaxID=414049 RepID=A0ABN1BT33_9BURK